METNWIVPILSLGTLLAIAVFALVSKVRTEQRRHDPDAPTSTLATDGRFGGVAPVVEEGLAGAPSGRDARIGVGRLTGEGLRRGLVDIARPALPPQAPPAPTVPRT